MNFDFFDLLDTCGNALDLLSNSSSGATKFTRNKKKKTKYVTEKISAVLYLFSAVFFFLVFRNPPASDTYVQSVVVASILGFAVSLVIFFILNVLEIYHFRSVFQWLFFSLSLVSFCISFVLWIYFKSGIF
jgi:hypothetical protein